MHKTSGKLSNLLTKLEDMIESNEAFKVGNQDTLLQLSLVKEQHHQLKEQVQQIHSSITMTDKKLRDDLDRHKSLKLELA